MLIVRLRTRIWRVNLLLDFQAGGLPEVAIV